MKKVINDLDLKNSDFDTTANLGALGLLALWLYGAKLCFIFVLKIMKGGKK